MLLYVLLVCGGVLIGLVAARCRGCRNLRLLIPLGLPFNGGTHVSSKITATQRIKVGPVVGQDARGNEAPLENLTFALREEDADKAVLVEVDGEPNSRFIQATGPIGIVQCLLNADALPGEGEEPLSGTVEVEITAAHASKLVAPVGAPEEIPGL